jgi:transcriptional regulator with XRE-family HTH domain
MKLVAPTDAARRTRAAIAYSGLELSEVAERTGIPPGTLRNIMSRTAPKSGRIERLWAIADACGIPRAFMEDGWAAVAVAEPPGSLDERVAALEESVRQFEVERQELLAAAAEQEAAEVARALDAGELPSDEQARATARRRAGGSRPP